MDNEVNDIGLNADEMDELSEVCKREGKTLAEKVREIVHSFLTKGDNHRVAV